jgi:hypothetical protein
MYLSRDNDFSSELSLGDLFVARDYFFEKINISRKVHSFWLKLSGYRKGHWTYIWAKFQVEIPYFNFFGKYIGMARKLSKMAITFEGRAMGKNPFRLFTTSIYSIK